RGAAMYLQHRATQFVEKAANREAFGCIRRDEQDRAGPLPRAWFSRFDLRRLDFPRNSSEKTGGFQDLIGALVRADHASQPARNLLQSVHVPLPAPRP